MTVATAFVYLFTWFNYSPAWDTTIQMNFQAQRFGRYLFSRWHAFRPLRSRVFGAQEFRYEAAGGLKCLYLYGGLKRQRQPN